MPKISCIIANYNQLHYLKKWVLPAWRKQTFKDFEIILAIDGSTDGTSEYAEQSGLQFVKNIEGGNYDWGLYNRAAKIAKGKYLVWVMGDSYPKEDYLEWMAMFLREKNCVSGIRINVDQEGGEISKDWRLIGVDERIIGLNVKWSQMTLNTMGMPKDLFWKLGGFCEEYKGYGCADMDLTVSALKDGVNMIMAPKAIVYHLDHGSRDDTKENRQLFARRHPGY